MPELRENMQSSISSRKISAAELRGRLVPHSRQDQFRGVDSNSNLLAKMNSSGFRFYQQKNLLAQTRPHT